MRKYLFYFGYVGTRFCGIQKNKYLGRNDGSIAAYLDEGLLSLSPLNRPYAITSSRTDAGVHAICSTFHSTLNFPPWCSSGLNKREEDYITSNLNQFFSFSCVDIRIHRTIKVPQKFHARHSALKRTYLYRLAQCTSCQIEETLPPCLPIVEHNRCCVFRGEFDIEAVQLACKILSGEHNFRFYSKVTESNRDKEFVRSLEIRVIPGVPLVDPVFDRKYENFRFWDVLVSSKGFLHNQVRRLVTILLGVGTGNIDLKTVKDSLSKPAWDLHHSVIAPDGLYLLSVDYPSEAFL